jgi:hypothetical protein
MIASCLLDSRSLTAIHVTHLSHDMQSCVYMQVDAALPDWLQEYMSGASQELYQLHHFPACLIGCSVREAAGFLFDAFHAVLLAVEHTGGPDRHRLPVGDLNQVRSMRR